MGDGRRISESRVRDAWNVRLGGLALSEESVVTRILRVASLAIGDIYRHLSAGWEEGMHLKNWIEDVVHLDSSNWTFSFQFKAHQFWPPVSNATLSSPQ